MTPPPRVSVVVPHYNAATCIADALGSIFAQQYDGIEVIVVNDASPDSDQLRAVLQPYLARIVFIDAAVNVGPGAARNIGIRAARAPLVAFLDADDVWLPEFLQALVAFLQQGPFDMVYADCEMFGDTRPGVDTRARNPPRGAITRRQLIAGDCHIFPSGTIATRAALERVGLFHEIRGLVEDFDLYMRMLFAGIRIGHLDRVLVRYRVWPSSGSADPLRRLQSNVDVWRHLQATLPFTEAENHTIERHVAIEEAAAVRVKGKQAIAESRWQDATALFSDAKARARALGLPRKHRMKLAGVLLLLRFAPGLLLWARDKRTSNAGSNG